MHLDVSFKVLPDGAWGLAEWMKEHKSLYPHYNL